MPSARGIWGILYQFRRNSAGVGLLTFNSLEVEHIHLEIFQKTNSVFLELPASYFHRIMGWFGWEGI